MVASGHVPDSSSETLDDATRRLEALQLLIRVRDGVPSNAFSTEDQQLLEELIVLREGRWVLTRAGRLMANEVSLRLRVVA
jgi:hypothetical protein